MCRTDRPGNSDPLRVCAAGTRAASSGRTKKWEKTVKKLGLPSEAVVERSRAAVRIIPAAVLVHGTMVKQRGGERRGLPEERDGKTTSLLQLRERSVPPRLEPGWEGVGGGGGEEGG